ncbi:MAG: CRISPR-associated protein Cas5 [Nitrososphaerales archaeon]
MQKQALVLAIEFFDALFKVHYTKGFRLTYPIPLPTTIAGIFSGMLGIERKDITKRFKGYSFGAGLSKGEVKETVEQYTFIQFGKNRLGVARTHILVDPAYYLVMAFDSKEELERIEKKIHDGIEYLPFGGQNDFFPKDWYVMGIKDTTVSTEVGNYLPSDWVDSLKKDVVIEILPVNHKLGDIQQFHFILNNHIISKKEVEVCPVNGKNIALYSLNDFYAVGEW